MVLGAQVCLHALAVGRAARENVLPRGVAPDEGEGLYIYVCVCVCVCVCKGIYMMVGVWGLKVCVCV